MHDFVAHLERIEEQLNDIRDAIKNPVSELMGFKEAAHYMRISDAHLRALKKNGEIDCYQPSPRIIRFSPEQCDKYLRGIA